MSKHFIIPLLIVFCLSSLVSAKKPASLSDQQMQAVQGAQVYAPNNWVVQPEKTCENSVPLRRNSVDTSKFQARSKEFNDNAATVLFNSPANPLTSSINEMSFYWDCVQKEGLNGPQKVGGCYWDKNVKWVGNSVDAGIDVGGTLAKQFTGVGAAQIFIGSDICEFNYLKNGILPNGAESGQCIMDSVTDAATFKPEDIPSIVISGMSMQADAAASNAGRTVQSGGGGVDLRGAGQNAKVWGVVDWTESNLGTAIDASKLFCDDPHTKAVKQLDSLKQQFPDGKTVIKQEGNVQYVYYEIPDGPKNKPNENRWIVDNKQQDMCVAPPQVDLTQINQIPGAKPFIKEENGSTYLYYEIPSSGGNPAIHSSGNSGGNNNSDNHSSSSSGSSSNKSSSSSSSNNSNSSSSKVGTCNSSTSQNLSSAAKSGSINNASSTAKAAHASQL